MDHQEVVQEEDQEAALMVAMDQVTEALEMVATGQAEEGEAVIQ